MSDQNPVVEEIPAFLAEHNNPVKGSIPHAKLVRLYIRYDLWEQTRNPKKKKARIRWEFSMLFKKRSTWALSYARLAKLHPQLLEALNVQTDPLYLSVQIALVLCTHRPDVQMKIFDCAKGFSQGEQGNLLNCVKTISKNLLRNKESPFSISTPVPAASATPTQEPIVAALPPPAPALADPAPKPLPRIITQERKSPQDEAFVKLLEQMAHSPPRRSYDPPPPIEGPCVWQGERRSIKGSSY